MYLLDTNVLSELRPGKAKADAAVLAWASALDDSQIHLSSISILELQRGILRLERRTPPQGAGLRAWFDGLRVTYAARILPFGESAALLCAALHVPNPRAERDAMIAATALEHGFAVVTRNVADFAGTGVRLVNPWEFEPKPA
ncbi:type II toxin-antitoxin system VapC family toxin [Ottowia testudinis]|uniref:Ribonuclease VapC n=1 Tax=Ottowia testudinis TaxID=2816950 RepID=A0A975CGV8_9BURK|nr:type II toxin-antitoxin system VapC family toxin [Ottowia testudinis]QTD45561.1 type II toxin-antitoxin system VapC family toxin [Ottowia testudinis]